MHTVLFKSLEPTLISLRFASRLSCHLLKWSWTIALDQSYSLCIGCFFTNFLSSPYSWAFWEDYVFFVKPINTDLWVTYQKWSPWKGGCQEAIYKKKKQGEKAELCQTIQEVDWKSVAPGLMEWWILPRASTSKLLKQCGIIMTENGIKGSRHPKKSFEMSFKEPGELFLKTT